MTPLTRTTPFTRALTLPAALLVAGGLLALSLPAASSRAAAAPTTLCKSQTPPPTARPNGTELMFWLNPPAPVQPFGPQVARHVSIGGRSYNAWYGKQAWNTVSYTMTSGTASVSNLDLQPLIADAVSRGYISTSWYLIDLEAGFELWQGCAGPAATAVSVEAAACR